MCYQLHLTSWYSNYKIVNVSNITLHNVKLINCIKHHKDYFNMTYLLNSLYTTFHSPSFSKITDYHTSVFLYNSSSVTICNMKIIATVMTNFTAILIVNTQDNSKVINIKVQINSFNCTTFSSHPVQISGLVAYYSRGIYKANSKLMITNFYYNNNYNSCENHFYCVVVLLFLQKIHAFPIRRMHMSLLKFSFKILYLEILKIPVYYATMEKLIDILLLHVVGKL